MIGFAPPRCSPHHRRSAPTLVALLALVPAWLFPGCRPANAPPPEIVTGSRVPAAQGAPGLAPDLGDVSNFVVASLKPGVQAQDLATLYGAAIVRNSSYGYVLFTPLAGLASALAESLRLDSRVLAAEVDAFVMPAEERQRSQAFDFGNGTPELYHLQSATDDVGMALAHRTSEGAGARIAILDTGAELTHDALVGHIAASADFIGTSIDGSEQGDGLDNDGDGLVDEAWGHGTHVAGIVALVAPRAQLLVGRVLDADGRGDLFSVAVAIEWAMAQDAQVINMSFGMLESSTVLEVALGRADAGGVVCVAAAGNEGTDSPAEYPGSSPHVLSVAALDASDRAATFTSYGSWVAISAPGVSIRSSYRDNTYALWSGTSMAAPFVSGTAGLLRSLHAGWRRPDVTARLAATARNVSAANRTLWPKLGAGALDAGAALEADGRWDARRGSRFDGAPGAPEPR